MEGGICGEREINHRDTEKESKIMVRRKKGEGMTGVLVCKN
jgi:hypothetical protein